MRNSLAWSYASHALSFALSFAGLVVISRLLTPRELGIFGIGIAISTILNTISSFGVANYIIREPKLDETTLATCFTVNAIMSVAAAAGIFLAASLGGELFSDPDIGEVLGWLALVPLLSALEMLPATLLSREMRFGPLSLLQLGKNAVNVAVMVASGMAGYSHLSPAFGAVAGAATGALAFSLYARDHVRVRWSLAGARKVVAFTGQIVSAGGLPIMMTRVAELIIAQWLGIAMLGVYTRASSLANMVWEGAYGLSTRIIYVQMAADLRETGSMRETYLRATNLITVIMWPAMAGIALLSGPIVHYVYGPQWDAAALPLAILMLGQCVAIAFAMSWELCILTGRTAWQARVEMWRAFTGIAALAAGALVSLPLAAAARILDALIGLSVYGPQIGAMAGATQSDTRAACAGNFALAVLAVAPSGVLMVLSGWSREVSVLQMVAAVTTGGLLWLAALAATRHALFEELRALLIRR